jgi:hypothetical protein
MRRACRVVSSSPCEQGSIVWATFRLMWEFLNRCHDTCSATPLPRIGDSRDFWSLVAACWVLGVKCVVDEDCKTNCIAAATFPRLKSPRHVLRAELRLLSTLDWRLPRHLM